MKRRLKHILKKLGLLKYVQIALKTKVPEAINYKRLRKTQERLVEQCKQKEKINVVFFLYFSATWKYDRVYKLLFEDEAFEPYIVIIPMMVWDDDTMIREMNCTYQWFKDRGYSVYKSYDEQRDIYLDVEEKFSPDIVFYSEPYDATIEQYRSDIWYKKALLCYSVYGFNTTNMIQPLYNMWFHNIIWKNFTETQYSVEQARKYAHNQGENMVRVGAPACDVFLDTAYCPRDVWHGTKLKRVIWAPHFYTIDESYDGWATFSIYYQKMIELAEKYKDKIYFILKPHPYLKATLYKHKNWGQEKTDKYFEQWEKMENTSVMTGDYADLFMTSDAIMHDSGSFIMEYVFTKKPVLYLHKDKYFKRRWNDNTLKAFRTFYPAYDVKDIDAFLENVVLKGDDFLKENRIQFLNDTLLPPYGKSASKNIVEHIKKELGK